MGGDWKENLLNAMTDDQLGNFQLVGTDDDDEVIVSCSKFLLAVQSPVFKRMFFGGGNNFQEREDAERRLQVNYHSSINRIIVKYCHSGELDLVSLYHDQPQDDDNQRTNAEIRRLLELRDAARFFQLDKILVRVEQEIGDLVFHQNHASNNPTCATRVCSTVLKEMQARGDDSGAFWDAFFHFAVESPMECFGECKSTGSENEEGRPHPRLLTRVLNNISDINLLIECLMAWSAPDESNKDAGTTSGIKKETLVEIASRVDLKTLSIQQLVKLKDYSLFSAEQLLEAIVHHHRGLAESPVSLPYYTTTTEIYVTGAGVGKANGHYQKQGMNCYIKQGQYGDNACRYEIQTMNSSGRWVLSAILLNDNSTIHLYQANAGLRAMGVPFTDWKCMEGILAPAPMVATIRVKRKTPPPAPAPAPTAQLEPTYDWETYNWLLRRPNVSNNRRPNVSNNRRPNGSNNRRPNGSNRRHNGSNKRRKSNTSRR